MKSSLPQCVACLYSIGWGIKRIIRHTGYAKTTVHRFAKEHGLLCPFTAAEKKAAEDLRRNAKGEATKAARRAKMEARKAALAARPKRSALDWYYANHEENRRRLAARAKARYYRTPKGSAEYIKRRLRSRIYNAIKRNARGAKSRASRNKAMPSMVLLGCDMAQLMAHLELLMLPGMTWENYGTWHIDHRIPCASFDLTDPKQQAACFHYLNLQPLWAPDNIRKSDTI